jgi:hypothetical protein
MCQLTRAEKHNIRKRDAKRIKLTGKCDLCGKDGEKTTRHHLWYSQKFIRYNIIEVCDECDCKLHNRNENDNWVQTLKSVRSIQLMRNKEYEYDIFVEKQKVGYARQTSNGIKLVITD